LPPICFIYELIDTFWEWQMKFNKKLTLAVTSALLAISSPTHAEINTLSDFLQADAPFKKDFSIADHDASVQFYGIVDIAYGHADHALPESDYLPQGFYPANRQAINGSYNSNNQSRNDWFPGGLSQNRIGIKADASLFKLENGTNINAVLNLESGFNPLGFYLYNGANSLAQNSGNSSVLNQKTQTISNESSQNGQLFNRAANAGLSFDQYGTVTFGLNVNPLKDLITVYDPVQADNFSLLGQSGTVGGSGGVSENQRLENSLKYTNVVALPSLPLEGAKLNVGGIYQWGNTVNINFGHSYGGQVGLDSNRFGAAVGYYRATDAISAQTSSTPNAIDFYSFNTEAWVIAARFNPVPELKISGGWEWFKRSNASDDLTYAYGDLWGTALTTSVTSRGNRVLGNGNTQDFNVYWLGASYDFGTQFPKLAGLKAQAGYYDYINEHPTGPTTISDATKAGAGRSGTWSAVLDYQINKRFDVYAATTESHFTGAYYSSAKYDPDQLVVATGLRFKF